MSSMPPESALAMIRAILLHPPDGAGDTEILLALRGLVRSIPEDLRDDPEFREWERDVREHLIPKLNDSAITISLAPSGDPDVKYAVELGMSIMMDKPIMLVIAPGQKVPRKLRQVADKIVAIDIRSPRWQELEGAKMTAAVESMMRKFADD